MSRFIEGLESPETLDPLAPDLHCDFPEQEIIAKLDGTTSELDGLDYERLRFALAEIFRWSVQVNLKKTDAQAQIGRRLLCLVWATNPELIKGSPPLAEIARSIGLSKASLSEISSEATRTFGVVNRFKAHGFHSVKPPRLPEVA